jgi:hypothetical protein
MTSSCVKLADWRRRWASQSSLHAVRGKSRDFFVLGALVLKCQQPRRFPNQSREDTGFAVLLVMLVA